MRSFKYYYIPKFKYFIRAKWLRFTYIMRNMFLPRLKAKLTPKPFRGVKIISFERFSSGVRRHAWVWANINGTQRLIKKPTNSIPDSILQMPHYTGSGFGHAGGAG